ncbi:protein FAM210B, mitochondrial-like [Condylostylus longicornis]|uniref:protein FAM210B, mitochondrial-like n=1 Tax=Condylostylus longicornis TaxID=2530218 RepID=UPI00244DBE97|nr:protein FAM210B, mitochondrial-like [Condylostylus longicornis]
MLAIRNFNVALRNNFVSGNLSSLCIKKLSGKRALLGKKFTPICYNSYKPSSALIYNPTLNGQNLSQNHEICYQKMSSSAKESSNDNKDVISKKDKFKKIIKEYGSTVIVFHVTISLLSLGGFYLLVSSGVNVIAILDWIGINTSKFATGSTFLLAYAIHKVFSPVRLSITIGAAPIIVRYLKKKNFLK